MVSIGLVFSIVHHLVFFVILNSKLNGCTGGDWDTSSEVFSFGVILLGLIAKRTCELEKPDIVLDRLLHVWAKKEYKPQCSLVHNSLQEDWGYHAQDGIAITELGMCCIEFFPRNRPTKMELQTRSPSYSKILSHVILISGVLSSASLASTLFPGLFITLVTLAIMLIYILYKHMYKWVVRANSQVCNILNRFLGCNTMQRQHLPT